MKKTCAKTVLFGVVAAGLLVSVTATAVASSSVADIAAAFAQITLGHLAPSPLGKRSTARQVVEEMAARAGKPASELLAGKVAVVTGGAGGIGLETAKVLASAGCRVVIGCRSPAVGDEAIKSEILLERQAALPHRVAASMDSAQNGSFPHIVGESAQSGCVQSARQNSKKQIPTPDLH